MLPPNEFGFIPLFSCQEMIGRENGECGHIDWGTADVVICRILQFAIIFSHAFSFLPGSEGTGNVIWSVLVKIVRHTPWYTPKFTQLSYKKVLSSHTPQYKHDPLRMANTS